MRKIPSWYGVVALMLQGRLAASKKGKAGGAQEQLCRIDRPVFLLPGDNQVVDIARP